MVDRVLDANVFIHGKKPDFDGCVYTTRRVVRELESKAARRCFELMDVEVCAVREDCLDRFRSSADSLNYQYSDADVSVVCLGERVDGVVVTDDKPLWTFCDSCGVRCSGFMT